MLKQIIGYIESSQRIVILGERRVGKSSAVYEAVLKCKAGRLLYADLLGIKSIDALCRRILRAIVVLEQKTGWFDKIIKTLSYLRPSISVDPVAVGMPVTRHPPHRSGREELPHPAPTSGSNAEGALPLVPA